MVNEQLGLGSIPNRMKGANEMHESSKRLLSFAVVEESEGASGESKICGLERDMIEIHVNQYHICRYRSQSHTKLF